MDSQFDIIDVEATKARDMSSGMVAKVKKPKRTWFVKRTGDGFVFACEEREAWDLLNNTSTWRRRDFVFIGCSDGKTYDRVTKESMGAAKKLEPEIAELELEFNRYRRAEESLLVNEAVDMDDLVDPINAANVTKIKRLRVIMDKIDAKLEAKKREFRTVTSDIVKTAMDAEQKVAEENWKVKRIWPGKVNIMTPAASPEERDRILSAMGGR